MSVPPSSVAITATNQSSIIMDVNTFQCNKDDATLFQIIDEVRFYEYPNCTGVGHSSFHSFPNDTVIMKAQFYVKQGTQNNPITLKNVQGLAHVYKEINTEWVELESISINTSGNLPNCDNVQEIDYTQIKDYLYPVGDCRNDIRLFRMPYLDIAGYVAYEFQYPFKIRWEDWRDINTSSGRKTQNVGYQYAYRCFPKPTENWIIYPEVTGWTPAFVIKAEVEDADTGHTTQFEHICWGSFKDPCNVPYSVEINTFDDSGVDSFEEIIGADQDTKVIATISGDFSGFQASQLYGILSLDAWGIGGVNYVQEIGTEINCDDDLSWYGAGSTLLATLTKVNNSTITLSAFLDYTKLPKGTNQYIIKARIGQLHTSTSSSAGGCQASIMIDAFTCGQLEIVSVTSVNVIVVRGSVNTAELRDVFVEDLILTFVTATTWTVSGGTIDGYQVIAGSVAGLVIKAPAHPYTNSNVGDVIQGELTGTIYSTFTQINGIGDMQIGCSFVVG